MSDSQKNLEGSLPHSLHFLIANIQKRIKNCNYGENSKNLQRLNELTDFFFYFFTKNVITKCYTGYNGSCTVFATSLFSY